VGAAHFIHGARDLVLRMRNNRRGRRHGQCVQHGGSAQRIGCLALVGFFVLVAIVATGPPALASTGGRAHATSRNPIPGNSPLCPWVEASREHLQSPSVLALDVLKRMTLSEKAGFVTLHHGNGVENFNLGVASLCIPALTLTDGPDGVAGEVHGVTRLPAAIGVAATFDPFIANETGQVLGAEARTKGIDVIQGPELNLARVAQSGRIYESFGEDPLLTSEMGVANVEGIQSQGVMAMAKHFSGYTQETARALLNQIIPLRALNEIYDAPFEAAVEQGHVAGVMCSIGQINSVHDCEDPYLYSLLRSWGFDGFVRSDERSALHPTQAFGDGLSLTKSSSAAGLVHLVTSHIMPVAHLNRAVKTVLTQMFAFGLIAHPRPVIITKPAATPAHKKVALDAAEASVVLLKNSGPVLPLGSTIHSVAVIGADAVRQAQSTGDGSSRVRASFVVAPLAAIRGALGTHVHVWYAPGGAVSLNLQHAQELHVVRGTSSPHEKRVRIDGHAGKIKLHVTSHANVTSNIATATQPGETDVKGWNHWQVVLHAQKSGTYVVTMQESGDAWLYFNGHQILVSKGLHASNNMSTTVRLHGGDRYTFGARWFAVMNHPSPTFGIVDATPAIRSAVARARTAQVAIVFAGEPSTEGADRPNLSLPGDENALINAVAAVNPRTVVVLNTGGAVLMPWLSRVAGVLEAWFPGEEDGTAIANVLDGDVDPSGRLPITFPASEAEQPTTAATQFPGVDSVVNFGTSTSALDVGYRWYQAHGVSPLFPFGFGLDYTTFTLSNPTIEQTPNGVEVKLNVTNTGERAGADVVQVYVQYPSSAGEPPDQLRAFTRVVLAPSSTSNVTLVIAPRGFQVFQNGSFMTLPGRYVINIGQSSADLELHVPIYLS
jgi:beta-glucosidase